jgi:hypothetical protein
MPKPLELRPVGGGILLPKALRRKPDRGTKKKELLLALASSMKLLVVVHEALRANGEHKSPLGEAIAAHASLCGSLLPNSMRLTTAEAGQIRADSQMPAESKIIKP